MAQLQSQQPATATLKELVIANRNSCQTTYCNPIRGKTEP